MELFGLYVFGWKLSLKHVSALQAAAKKLKLTKTKKGIKWWNNLQTFGRRLSVGNTSFSHFGDASVHLSAACADSKCVLFLCEGPLCADMAAASCCCRQPLICMQGWQVALAQVHYSNKQLSPANTQRHISVTEHWLFQGRVPHTR